MFKLYEWFTVVRPYKVDPKDRGDLIHLNTDMRMGHYMTIDGGNGIELGHQSAWVQGSEKMMNLLRAQTIIIQHDIISFNLIIFSNYANLYALYGSIIGSIEVGPIFLDSLPTWIKTKSDTE